MLDSAPKRRLVFLTALPVEYQAVRAYLTDLEEKKRPGLEYEQGKLAGVESLWDVYIIETGQGNHPVLLFFLFYTDLCHCFSYFNGQ